MPKTFEEMCEGSNPYDDFKSEGKLAEHRKSLDKLDEVTQKNLAEKLIKNCPQQELRSFSYQLRSISTLLPDTTTFYAVIEPFYQIKKRVFDLLDPGNPNPQTALRESLKLFEQHKEFTLEVIKDNEKSIANRLFNCTKKIEQKEIIDKLARIFPKSNFVDTIESKFNSDLEDSSSRASPTPYFLLPVTHIKPEQNVDAENTYVDDGTCLLPRKW